VSHELYRLIKNHFFWIITVLILVFVLSAADVPILASILAPLAILTVPANGAAYLSAIVQAIATILAIQFSVSILAVQHASANYSPTILERFRKNPKVLYTYLFEASALGFSAFALFGTISPFFLGVSFVMFLSTLVYLFAHFSLTLDLVNPKSVILSLESDANSRIVSVSQIRLRRSQGSSRRPLFQRFRRTSRNGLIDFAILDTSRNTIIALVNILQKSAARRDYETCVAGFRSLGSISQSYVMRTKSIFRADDSFITFLLGQLAGVSKIAFDNPDLMILIEAVRAVQRVGSSAIAISPFPRSANLSAKLGVYYLGEMGTTALASRLNDVAAAASGAIGYLGSMGLENTQDDLLAPNVLARIGRLSSKSGQWFVTQRVVYELLTILSSGIKAMQPWSELDGTFESMANIVAESVENGQGNPVVYSLTGMLPNTGLAKIATETLAIKGGSHPLIETAWREEYVRDIFRMIIETLEQAGNAGTKRRDGLVTLVVAEALHAIGIPMIDEKFKNPKGFSNELEQLLDVLTSIYPSNRESLAEDFVPKAIAHLATRMSDKGLDLLAAKAVEALQQIAVGAVSADDEYTSQRVAENIVTVGSYAVKLGKGALSDKCIELLLAYDEKYRSTTTNPKDGLYFDELEDVAAHEVLGEKQTRIIFDRENLDSFRERYQAKRNLPGSGKKGGKTNP
jgi:hypothetical protein